jgi:hypothetical protein
MNIIIKNDNFYIGQDVKDNKSFTIFFDSYNEALIKSIAKTRIILGATTTEKYKTLTFKASSVLTFSDFQKEIKRETGSNILTYNLALNMTHNLVTQLKYLICVFFKTFLGYSLDNLIVIDKQKFVYLSSEYLLDIDDNENILIKFPFSSSDFFCAPELLHVKEIPSFVHYKASYFSLACLLLSPLSDPLLGKVEQNMEHFKNMLNTLTIKNTKLYWLLERSLVEEPKNRSILFI